MNLENRRLLVIVLVLIGIVLIFLSILKLNSNKYEFKEFLKEGSTNSLDRFNCEITEKELVVRGNSLAPLINDGDKIKILENYYNCNEAKKDDIVVYKYFGSIEPLIKIIKGLPGDKLEIIKNNNDGWNIVINGNILKNSENEAYLLNESEYRILSLYINDYDGIIPDSAYLILSNSAVGGLDSRRFGLVGKSDFLGRVKR